MIQVNPHKYRVVAGANPLPALVYEGEDRIAAVQAFYDSWPKAGVNFHPGFHSVTGEPMVEMRRSDDNTMAAALYGISAEEWAEVDRFWSALPDGVEDPEDLPAKEAWL